MKLRRRGVVVLDGVAPAQHLGVLQAGDEPSIACCTSLRQARADAVAVILQRVAALRLQEDLVAILVGEAHHLVLDRRAVARPATLDLPGVHRGAVQVGADQVVDLGRGVGDVAHQLRLRRCGRSRS